MRPPSAPSDRTPGSEAGGGLAAALRALTGAAETLDEAWEWLSPTARRLAAAVEAKQAAAAIGARRAPPSAALAPERLRASVEAEVARLAAGAPWGTFEPGWLAMPLPAPPGARLAGWRLAGGRVSAVHGVLVAEVDRTLVLRLADRRLQRLALEGVLVTTLTPPSDSSEAADRRGRFDRFLAAYPGLRPAAEGQLFGHRAMVHVFTCPACGYPTRVPSVEGPGARVQTLRDATACPTCGWADAEGLDDEASDESSPSNAGYTLQRARANVERGGLIFDPEDGCRLATVHRQGAVAGLRRQARTLLAGVLRLEEGSFEQFEAWRAAFAVLDRMPRRTAVPCGVCELTPPPSRGTVEGLLGPDGGGARL